MKTEGLVGAGGNWRVIDECPDGDVIKQLTSLACVAATGVMLARSRGITVTQQELLAKIGMPASVQALAAWLNQADPDTEAEKWYGGFVSTNNFVLLSRRGAWGAVLREGTPLGHLVLVEGVDKQGLVLIKDPFNATSYRMLPADFLAHWGGEVIIKWKF